MSDRDTWEKKITVDKRIVRILSESTYENFPTALKEIITNSYDADSTEVHISLDMRNETIEILDNGKGMSVEEFDFFLRIAGFKREKDKNTTNSGRFVIGKFGVGFLSIFPYFKNYTVESTKAGSEKIFYSSIPCYKYMTSGQLVEVSQIPILGTTKVDRNNKARSFTKITLSGFTALTKEFFFPSTKVKLSKNSVRSYSGLEKLKWQLAEDLPIEYEEAKFNGLTTRYSPNLPFSVFINKLKLLRPVPAKILLESNGVQRSFNMVYSKDSLEVNESKIMTIGKIKFQYFIATDRKAIDPVEHRGIKRRNLNAGVGERTAYGLGTEIKGARSRLQWLTGELLIIEGANELINVQRTDFYFDADFEKLREFMIAKISHHAGLLEKEAEYINEQADGKIKKLKWLEEDEELVESRIKNSKKHTVSIDPDDSAGSSQPQIDLFGSASKSLKNKASEQKISKSITIKGTNYKVKVGRWDSNELFGALKMDVNSKIITINQSYPLFGGVKYNDVFIRMHILLLLNYTSHKIEKSVYIRMCRDIIDIYSDYIK